MNGYIFWNDKYILNNPLHQDAIPQSIALDVVDIICQYFNEKYGEGEMIHYWVVIDETEDTN